MLNYTDILNNKDISIISEKTGLGKKFVIKEAVLMKILSYLEPLNKKMILKGGTAINKIYLQEPRFSEDLDYEILDKNVINETANLLNNNFKIKKRNMNGNIRLDCFYTSLSNETDRIMIDFRYVDKFEDTEFKIAKSLIFKDLTSAVQTYSFKKIVAQKINALLNRKDGKDLYDCYFLVQQLENKEIFIKNRKNILNNLIKFDDKSVYTSVSHYLIIDKKLDLKTVLKNFESLLCTLK